MTAVAHMGLGATGRNLEPGQGSSAARTSATNAGCTHGGGWTGSVNDVDAPYCVLLFYRRSRCAPQPKGTCDVTAARVARGDKSATRL